MDLYETSAAGDAVLLHALYAYDEYRGGLTPEGQQETLTNLQKFPRADWAAILTQSVQRRWKYLYPLKKSAAAEHTNTLDEQVRKYGPIGPKIRALEEILNEWEAKRESEREERIQVHDPGQSGDEEEQLPHHPPEQRPDADQAVQNL